jgi:hypothetical protein
MGTRKEKEAGHRVNEELNKKDKDRMSYDGPKGEKKEPKSEAKRDEAEAGRRVNKELDRTRPDRGGHPCNDGNKGERVVYHHKRG